MFFSCFLSQIIIFFTGFFSISTFLHVHIFLHRKKRVLFSVSSQCRLSSFVIFYCGCEKISIVFFTIYVVVCFCFCLSFILLLLLPYPSTFSNVKMLYTKVLLFVLCVPISFQLAPNQLSFFVLSFCFYFFSLK